MKGGVQNFQNLKDESRIFTGMKTINNYNARQMQMVVKWMDFAHLDST